MKSSVLVAILATAAICAAQLDPEQCGPSAGNQKCGQNKCCSQYGWCGTSNAYCRTTQGCQSGFGRCTGVLSSLMSSPSSFIVGSPSVVASPLVSAASISRNGRCGSAFSGQTCKGSTFGDCCSIYNWCGKTANHCKASLGCQLGFGTCIGVQSSSISVPLSRTSSQRSSSSPVSSSAPIVTTSALQSSSTSSPLFPSSSSTRISTDSSAALVSTSSGFFSDASSSLSTVSSALVAASSSSAIASSSSAIASSSSAIASSSSAIASSSSSSLMSSGSTTLASPSLTLISSTSTFRPSVSASGSATVITHVLRAARNPSVDRTAPEHLVPKNAFNFFFAEDGTSYTTSVQANLDSGTLGVLLENIASISSVTCSGSNINLQFTDEASANTARSWPEGTILFTLSDGCNTATERGVYRLRATTATPAGKLRIRATSVARATNVYSLSFEALLIQMEAVIANYDDLKRMAAEAAAATASASIPTPPGTSPSVQITSTASSVLVSSSTGAQPTASATSLPACGGYAPGGRFDVAGTSYQVSCTLAGTWRERWIDISYQESFTACMAHCNANAQCVVASWNEQQVVNGKYMCLRWALLPFMTDNAANSPMAVKIVSISSAIKPVTLVTSTVAVSASVSSSSARPSSTVSSSA